MMNETPVKGLRILILLVALWTLLSSMTVVAQPTGPPLIGTLTQITSDPSLQTFPSKSGNTVIWEDRRLGGSDVFMFNLTTGIETPVTNRTSSSVVFPDISGDRIVWDEANDVFLLNLATGAETAVTADPSAQVRPVVSGDVIIWLDFRNGRFWDLFAVDFPAIGNEMFISGTVGMTGFPRNLAVSGRNVIWEDQTAIGDVSIFNFDTGVLSPLIVAPTNRCRGFGLDIDGNRVVRADCRLQNPGNHLDIYLLELDSGVETRITDDSAVSARLPSISGERIVWTDLDLDTLRWEIFTHDLQTGLTQRLGSAGVGATPMIDGKQVVWDPISAPSMSEILMFDIRTGPPANPGPPPNPGPASPGPPFTLTAVQGFFVPASAQSALEHGLFVNSPVSGN